MQYVYFFGDSKADGTAEMKELLGGKGANLAEMTNLGIPVPPGFTITTEVCTHYYANDQNYPSELRSQVEEAISKTEDTMGRKFGDPTNPLLMSVRSGARISMPGMMETVLNVGLTSKTIPGLIEKSGNPKFVYDAYRRLITMYADVVMEKAAGVEPKDGISIRERLEELIDERKKEKGVHQDTDLDGDDWKELSDSFKTTVKDVLGSEFPDDPHAQLWGGISAVFQSWNGKRAISYRRIEGVPEEWGTAVNVQTMVFGNMGNNCATGVGFTRNPATGENHFYGEWLSDAQGEDVVAGIRTPNPINKWCRTEQNKDLPTLEEEMSGLYEELDGIRINLEKHYADMQDIEFTIENDRLWMLQTRVGKRNGMAAVKMATDMLTEGLIEKETALNRVKPSQLDELLHPMVDPDAEATATKLAEGLPAGPGGATGQIVFTADDAEAWAKDGKKVILVRNETSPEDVHGMHAAEAILTAKGGMTSHAALVARGWGKCCVVGCGALNIDSRGKKMSVDGHTLNEGDVITLNGTKGFVYNGDLPVVQTDPTKNESFRSLMEIADDIRKLGIRTNADSPDDAAQARDFGAEGIGLCRTEHMFFDPERILAMRELIIAEDKETRRKAIMKLLPFQRQDFYGILKAMHDFPVTIRLLDPPLHEFVTLAEEQVKELAAELGTDEEKLKTRIAALHELNPMLGHRGCRLGIAYPEITEMQARAIFEATAQLTKEGINALPEVMIPLVGTQAEYDHQEAIVRRIADEVKNETDIDYPYLVGTMIEIPRACLTADEIARKAEFFSFGTNDLTQTTFGFSRDDIGGFLPAYLEEGILPEDPFQSLDQSGVGQLVEMAVEKGRSENGELKIGICGEHGGDPASIHFCYRTGLDYVSCSPFRVPIARLAAAQAVLANN
ncbi:MAG: pyruvate, phosphate dikinase [Candidatus Marinimicrobia bacterium]|nr:pyruvate, phosphate dikinase [Candidatus Neomarinimicrobiota bacterium]MDP7060543.1 pyruvate, phosphate dikinase [Candidatus Neomarinimicrobiota bacterium]